MAAAAGVERLVDFRNADLLAGIEVICYGELYSDNTMTAARIELVPEQTEELEPPAEE